MAQSYSDAIYRYKSEEQRRHSIIVAKLLHRIRMPIAGLKSNLSAK